MLLFFPPIRCEVCGFQCRQRASLKYHMTKHKAEADLEFECLMCSKRFEKAHNLNVHMSMVHPLTQAEAQRGSGQQQQTYPDLHTITLTGEVVQQEQDRWQKEVLIQGRDTWTVAQDPETKQQCSTEFHFSISSWVFIQCSFTVTLMTFLRLFSRFVDDTAEKTLGKSSVSKQCFFTLCN